MLKEAGIAASTFGLVVAIGSVWLSFRYQGQQAVTDGLIMVVYGAVMAAILITLLRSKEE